MTMPQPDSERDVEAEIDRILAKGSTWHTERLGRSELSIRRTIDGEARQVLVLLMETEREKGWLTGYEAGQAVISSDMQGITLEEAKRQLHPNSNGQR